MKNPTAKKLTKYYSVEVVHSLYREDGIWYHVLEDFPGALLDKNGLIIFNDINEYENNVNLNINRRTNMTTVKRGISELPGYISYVDLRPNIPLHNYEVVASTSEATLRARREVDFIIRNNALVTKVKEWYDNTCQICGEKLVIGLNKHYSEVHHIKPLGMPHNGPDELENMICVCPNHHAQLDFGAIKLDINTIKKAGNHEISLEHVTYHNNVRYSL